MPSTIFEKIATVVWPELARFPEPAQRKRAGRRMVHNAYFQFVVVPSAVVLYNLVLFAGLWGLQMMADSTTVSVLLMIMTLGLSVPAATALLLRWIFGPPMRRRLRVDLNAIGIPTCVRCGYDLRAHDQHGQKARCPECGHTAAAGQLEPPSFAEPKGHAVSVLIMIAVAVTGTVLFWMLVVRCNIQPWPVVGP